MKKFLPLLLVGAFFVSDAEARSFQNSIETNFYGFLETRAGGRLQDDPYEKDISVMETRLQLEGLLSSDWIDFKYKGDLWGDGITKKAEYDARETYFFSRPLDFMDIKLGRQVLTWGTGDLVFLNDLFPKDWQSFFIGRDAEYLKAPSDAVKIGLFSDVANLDIVYTPQFDPDRFVSGEYLSYWSGQESRLVGQDRRLSSSWLDHWFDDDEVALRLYKTIEGYEVAAYFYNGFWKTPVGETDSGTFFFPRLNVYGSSLRGQVAAGIGNIELAYYQSVDDENGSNKKIKNSEMRYLVGYAQELAQDLSGSFQYYIEQMLDYAAYKKARTGGREQDRFRHVITFQLTQLFMNQNLETAFSGYYSLSDEDAYLRPHIQYKFTDHITFETGANVFFGNDERTFFAQFEKNSNIYVSARYSF